MKQLFHDTQEQQQNYCAVSTPFVIVPEEAPEKFIPTPKHNGPLSGLGLAVKDLFHMQGLPTGAGNTDWLATHTVPDATNETVSALLNAGAHFTGKTITDELAYSLHGQNKHFEPLINPAAPSHIPGGSSSGSAVAMYLIHI